MSKVSETRDFINGLAPEKMRSLLWHLCDGRRTGVPRLESILQIQSWTPQEVRDALEPVIESRNQISVGDPWEGVLDEINWVFKQTVTIAYDKLVTPGGEEAMKILCEVIAMIDEPMDEFSAMSRAAKLHCEFWNAVYMDDEVLADDIELLYSTSNITVDFVRYNAYKIGGGLYHLQNRVMREGPDALDPAVRDRILDDIQLSLANEWKYPSDGIGCTC